MTYILRCCVRYKKGLLIIFILLGYSLQIFSQSVCKPVSLMCEYLIDPLGIDVTTPRLTWRIDDKRMGAKQTAYEICVSTDSLEASKGRGIIWQTGKISADKQLINYKGKSLIPFTRYYWSVRVWDKDGKPSSWSAVNSFETGLMNSSNWKGAWISDSRDIKEKAAPYFRKSFSTTKKIKSARAYIAVGGLYELYINGESIGDQGRRE